MNNERLLYNYIKANGGTITDNYSNLSAKLNVGISTVKRYKNLLVANKYITCTCKCVGTKKQLILKLTKKIVED